MIYLGCSRGVSCLTNDTDVDVLLRGTQFVRKWVGTKPIADLVDELVTPPASVETDGQWTKYMKTVVRVCCFILSGICELDAHSSIDKN